MRYLQSSGLLMRKISWGIVGLLHDLGFEKYRKNTVIKSQEIMKERGIDGEDHQCNGESRIRDYSDIKPEHEMEKKKYCVRLMSSMGLIGSCCIDASVQKVLGSDIKVPVKKEKIQEQEFRNRMFQRSHRTWSGQCLDGHSEDLIQRTIDALKTFQD